MPSKKILRSLIVGWAEASEFWKKIAIKEKLEVAELKAELKHARDLINKLEDELGDCGR